MIDIKIPFKFKLRWFLQGFMSLFGWRVSVKQTLREIEECVESSRYVSQTADGSTMVRMSKSLSFDIYPASEEEPEGCVVMICRGNPITHYWEFSLSDFEEVLNKITKP